MHGPLKHAFWHSISKRKELWLKFPTWKPNQSSGVLRNNSLLYHLCVNTVNYLVSNQLLEGTHGPDWINLYSVKSWIHAVDIIPVKFQIHQSGRFLVNRISRHKITHKAESRHAILKNKETTKWMYHIYSYKRTILTSSRAFGYLRLWYCK